MTLPRHNYFYLMDNWLIIGGLAKNNQKAFGKITLKTKNRFIKKP